MSDEAARRPEASRAGPPGPLRFAVRHLIMATGNTSSWPGVRPAPCSRHSPSRANLGKDSSASSHMTHLSRPPIRSVARNPIQTTAANSCSGDQEPLGFLWLILCRAGHIMLLISSQDCQCSRYRRSDVHPGDCTGPAFI